MKKNLFKVAMIAIFCGSLFSAADLNATKTFECPEGEIFRPKNLTFGFICGGDGEECYKCK
jgi:hypothetical protein